MTILRLYWATLFLLAISGAGIALAGMLWGLIPLALAVLSLRGFREIPADPPHVGILTLWGRRVPEILKEGLVLLANYLPFFIDIILINTEKKNIDFVFENVRCRLREDLSQASEDDSENGVASELKSGGSVTVYVSMTLEPNQDDPEQLISYINSGPAEKNVSTGKVEGGVIAIIEDMLGEDIRQMGSSLTWLDMEFSQNRISAILIKKMTGKKICRVKREKDDKNTPTTDSDGKYAFEEFSPSAELNSLDYACFLERGLENGAPDIHDLGIKIRRLNIKRVVPEGVLAEDAELAAREALQRQAEGAHIDTEIWLAQKYRESTGGRRIPLEKALEFIRLNRNKNAQEIFVRSDGNPLDQIVAAIAMLKQQNHGGNGDVTS